MPIRRARRSPRSSRRRRTDASDLHRQPGRAGRPRRHQRSSTPAPLGTVALDGEPTSVTVVGETVLVAVNTSPSYHRARRRLAAVDRASRASPGASSAASRIRSPRARTALPAVAIENERDEELNDGAIPQLPAGTLAIFELDDDRHAPQLRCGADGRPDRSCRGRARGPGARVRQHQPAPTSSRSRCRRTTTSRWSICPSGEVAGHFSAGAVDLAAIDTEEDGIIAGTGSLDGRAARAGRGRLARRRAARHRERRRLRRAARAASRSSRGRRGALRLRQPARAPRHGARPLPGGPRREQRRRAGGRHGRPLRRGTADLRQRRARQFRRGVPRRRARRARPSSSSCCRPRVGPEGAAAIPARDLLVVASEVDAEEDGLRGTLGIYARSAARPPYPTVVSQTDPATGAPIGWGALSGLVGRSERSEPTPCGQRQRLRVSRIFTLDVAAQPAAITGYLDLTKDGAPAGYDLEGIALREGGGFWLVSEGDPEAENPVQQKSLLLAVAEDGRSSSEIPLPDAAYEQASPLRLRGCCGLGRGGGRAGRRRDAARLGGRSQGGREARDLRARRATAGASSATRSRRPSRSAAAGSACPRSPIWRAHASPCSSATTSPAATP